VEKSYPRTSKLIIALLSSVGKHIYKKYAQPYHHYKRDERNMVVWCEVATEVYNHKPYNIVR